MSETAQAQRRHATPRSKWTVAAIIAVAVALLGGGTIFTSGSNSKPKPTNHARQIHHNHPAAPATFTGPDGVKANWVIQQNRLPGTTAWKITTTPNPSAIMGYTNRPQARAGQTMTLYVSTAAPTFVIQAYRMGYYGGAGGRLVWHSKSLPGIAQPSCPASPPLYMVQCNWSPATTVAITKNWVQGDYLLKLVASTGAQSYIPLTVWDPSSHATYVIMNANLTWQAFNSFGGYDLYQGGPPGLTGYPPPQRSRVLSFDRPYGYGNGAANFMTNEYPLIRFMEKHGLNVTYWTDITLAIHGNLLTNHRVLLSLGHDEEWSTRMRANVVNAHNQGVNLAFFGASPVLRKVRLQPSPLGPNLEVVNYRDPQADPLYGVNNAEVTQNWWGQPPANLPASTLVGNTYIGYNNTIAFPMMVTDASSWLYQETGLKNGQAIPGVLRYDFDGYNPTRPNPPGVEILSHSPVTIGFNNAHMFADTTYVTDSTSGAGVFESGTNYWIASLARCPTSQSCPTTIMRTMTANILRLFGNGPAGKVHPSIGNTSTYYPSSSTPAG
ncbi:MAG: N,N-dimethylformamidase beta subunit family domain-containing protein [Ferrimicrobium sp.]